MRRERSAAEALELLEDVREVLRLHGHAQGVRSAPSCASSARSALISGAAATGSKAGAAFQS